MLGLRNASRSWIVQGPILKDDGGSAKICTMIITAAGSANCEKLWSEDLNDGQVIRGVLIENPLKEEK